MILGEVITLGSLFLVGFGTIGGFLWKISSDANSKIIKVSDESESRTGRVYTRLDEVKEKLKQDLKEYTQDAVCAVRHAALDQTIQRMEIKIDDVGKKIDRLLERRSQDVRD